MTEVSHQDKSEYAACALVDYAQRHKAADGLQIAVEEISDLLLQDFGIPFGTEEINGGIEYLTEIGIAETVDSGHSRPYFLVSYSQFDKRSATSGWHGLIARSGMDSLPIVKAYYKLGARWLAENLRVVYADSLKAQQDHNDVITSILAKSGNLKAPIPASDRIVSIDHNQHTVQQIVAKGSELKTQLIMANDLGALSVSEAKIAAFEVQQIVDSFQSDGFRSSLVYEKAKSTLNWISSKAAEAMVGALALTFLTLIANFLGFAL